MNPEAAAKAADAWSKMVIAIGLGGALAFAVVLLLFFTLRYVFKQAEKAVDVSVKQTDRLYAMIDHHTQVYVEQNAGWREVVAEISETMKEASKASRESSETVCQNMRTLAGGLNAMCRHPDTRTRATDHTS